LNEIIEDTSQKSWDGSVMWKFQGTNISALIKIYISLIGATIEAVCITSTVYVTRTAEAANTGCK
jgi:hypothetical protein